MKASSLINWSAFLLAACLWSSHDSLANTLTQTNTIQSSLGQCVSIRNNVWVDDRVRLNAQSLALGGNLTVGANAAINAHVNVGLRGDMRDRSVIDGDTTVGTTMSLVNESVIKGKLLQHTSTDDVVIHTLPLLPSSGDDVNIDLGITSALSPGNYRAIKVSSRGKLELSSGNYYFESLDLNTNSSLVYGGDVRVVVNGAITISQQSRVVALSDNDTLSLYSHHSGQVKLGEDVSFTGQIHSPNSKVNVGARAIFKGCINARGLQFFHDSQFNEGTFIPIFNNPPTLLTGQCLSVGNNLRLDDRAVLDSDTVAVGGNLRVFANATIDSDINVRGSAMMRDRSVILGDANIGQTMTLINHASVSGILSEQSSTDDVVINSLSKVPTQGSNVWVGLDKTKTLTPGNYRNIKIASRGKLFLNAGEYQVGSLNLATNTSVVYRGEVTVFVNNKLVILDRSSVTGESPSDTLSLYTHQSDSVKLATDVHFEGQIHAPKAQVRLGARSLLEGCVNSKGLRLFHDSRLSKGEYIPVL